HPHFNPHNPYCKPLFQRRYVTVHRVGEWALGSASPARTRSDRLPQWQCPEWFLVVVLGGVRLSRVGFHTPCSPLSGAGFVSWGERNSKGNKVLARPAALQ